ncbi:MAG: porin [Fuerstiella sp.]
MRRARIGIHGTVPPDNMSYRLELEFSGQDGGRIRDAWLGWDDLPILNTLRIGNQKRPCGLEHLNSSNFMTFLERPFVVEAFNTANRRIGLASYGASPDKAWNWQYGVFNMVQIQDTNDIVGDDAQMEIAGRLASTYWYDESSNGRGYAHFALAGTLAFPDGNTLLNQAVFQTTPEARTKSDWLDTGLIAGAESYRLFAVESVLNVGPLQVVGEWMNIQLQRDAASGSDIQLNGGYVALSYFLTGEHIPWDRRLGTIDRMEPVEDFFWVRTCDGDVRSGLGAWQIALRLSRADFNDSDIQGGVGESLTLALNWYWNSHTRLQCNYIWGQIDGRRTTLTNNATPVVSGNYQVMGTRFMIDFQVLGGRLRVHPHIVRHGGA